MPVEATGQLVPDGGVLGNGVKRLLGLKDELGPPGGRHIHGQGPPCLRAVLLGVAVDKCH